MDWINTIKEERDRGIHRPLLQSQHAEVNARYPRCTTEMCCDCDEPTGHAGKGDGSLYTDAGEGPYCCVCWDELREQMTNIQYLIGDATQPAGDGNKIIVHCCNDVGVWGAGFVLALSRRWAEPEEEYRRWSREGRAKPPFVLGQTQFVQVSPDILIANVIGQRGTGCYDGRPPIRYPALREGLLVVAQKAREISAMVHMPRLGCGLAGGSWDLVSSIINETLVKSGIDAIVYDLPAMKNP